MADIAMGVPTFCCLLGVHLWFKWMTRGQFLDFGHDYCCIGLSFSIVRQSTWGLDILDFRRGKHWLTDNGRQWQTIADNGRQWQTKADNGRQWHWYCYGCALFLLFAGCSPMVEMTAQRSFSGLWTWFLLHWTFLSTVSVNICSNQ